MNRKAMILAAGLGTRLGEVTRHRPKALLTIHGIPLVEILLHRLQQEGFGEVVINLHHHAEMIRDYLKNHTPEGMRVLFSEEKEGPLETGGGVRHARGLLLDAGSFLLHNVDILSDIALRDFMDHHETQESMVTLAVSRRKTTRYLLADEEDNLCGWENTSTGEKVMVRPPAGTLTRGGYSGVAALRREALFLLPEEEAFSLTPFFLNLSGEHVVKVYEPAMSYWYDVGKPGMTGTVEKELTKEKLLAPSSQP